MRLVAGTTLVVRAVIALSGGLAIVPAALFVFQIPLGMLLLVGLWTPVAGTLVALLQFWRFVSESEDPWIHILLATLGLGLALLGPGAWSIDARLFGWRRIDIRDRHSRPHAPLDP
jgi:putative oxidoreductase